MGQVVACAAGAVGTAPSSAAAGGYRRAQQAGPTWCSWIHRDDVVGMVLEAIRNPEWQGAYNATAPNPVGAGGRACRAQACKWEGQRAPCSGELVGPPAAAPQRAPGRASAKQPCHPSPCCPHPTPTLQVRMGELCSALGSVMGRPSLVPVPDFALRTLLGEVRGQGEGGVGRGRGKGMPPAARGT